MKEMIVFLIRHEWRNAVFVWFSSAIILGSRSNLSPYMGKALGLIGVWILCIGAIIFGIPMFMGLKRFRAWLAYHFIHAPSDPGYYRIFFHIKLSDDPNERKVLRNLAIAGAMIITLVNAPVMMLTLNALGRIPGTPGLILTMIAGGLFGGLTARFYFAESKALLTFCEWATKKADERNLEKHLGLFALALVIIGSVVSSIGILVS